MANSQATVFRPRRIQTRAWLIMSAVAVAVAVPILPLRFLGIPGPDFPDVSQVVTTSRNWLSQVTSRIDAPDPREAEKSAPAMGSPAEQVKMLEGAAEQLKVQIQQSPSDPALQNRLGLIYLCLGESDQASQYFQKAVSLSRLGITALTDKIASLRQEGRTREASSALLEASKLNVELSAAHSNLARVYEKRGEHDKVISELDLLNKEGVLFDNNAAQPQVGNRTAMLNPQIARDLARAEAYMQSRQMPAAANEYRHILAQDPNIAMAHHRLGTILAMSGQGALAIDELEIAARLDGGSPEIQNDLGLAYQNMGLHAQSVKSFERALALEPRMTEAAINLSNAYCSQNRTQEAEKVLSDAIANNPNNAKAHNNLGTLFSMEGKWNASLYEFQKAVALAPDMPSAHYGLGTVMMNTKAYLPAAREFKQALALNPNLVDAQTKIEEAQRKAGLAQGPN
jgi:tetratricopeptide (TPR) repeat protein